MAHVRVPSQNITLDDPERIRDFLAPFGITYERWPEGAASGPDADSEEILSAYAGEIERLKAKGGYVTADVINLTKATPGLDAMLERFQKEHTHSEDEIRFILKGRGIFHIHPTEGPVFSIETVAGDLITVPAGTRHWFHLCEERTIRAIRLFKDPAGWSPAYIEDGVHAEYSPVCLGPSYVSPAPGLGGAIPIS